MKHYPLLSSGGSLRTGEKSDIITHLKGLFMTPADTKPVLDMPKVDGAVLDGPVISSAYEATSIFCQIGVNKVPQCNDAPSPINNV